LAASIGPGCCGSSPVPVDLGGDPGPGLALAAGTAGPGGGRAVVRWAGAMGDGWLQRFPSGPGPGASQIRFSMRAGVPAGAAGRSGCRHAEVGGTGLAGEQGTEWSSELLDVLGLPGRCMPRILPPDGQAGVVTAAAAVSTELPAGTPVVVGTSDFHAALLGSAAFLPDRISLYLGTAGVLQGVPEPHRPQHVRPGRQHSHQYRAIRRRRAENWARH
jgi:hypothetical protein